MNDRTIRAGAGRRAAIGLAVGALALVAALAPAVSHAQDTRPVRPSPEQCEKQCDARARAMYKSCVDGGTEEARCAARAREAAQKCKAACGTETKPPPSVIGACQRDCSVKAREAHKSCLDNGGDPAACSEAARTALRECTAACPKPEPQPNPNCDRLCARAAAHAAKRCLDAGGSEDSCNAVEAETLAQCARRCARADKPVPGTGPRPR